MAIPIAPLTASRRIDWSNPTSTKPNKETLMSINVIVPESARKTYEDWHFASAVRHDDLIFFSGVVGWGNSPEDEFKNAWASLGVTLAEAGVGCEDIIDTTIYMVDLPRLRHAKSNLIAQKESGL
jgi:enamine deaminase RidA (YjgF/YER057c/UK114 family)